MPRVIRLEQPVTAIRPKKKVAAYARVSMETERLNHSLSAQVSYYSSLIQRNPDWQYAGVFADNGISGTGIAKREEFQRMLEAADNGEIDIILTKSIQRFARNTVDLLQTVRHLKDIGVEVRFEKENISTLSGDGELMLTILASFAQEESRSISENVKWGTRKRFAQGIPNGRFQIFGYRWAGDQLVVEPEEAKIVRLIYDNYLNGLSAKTTEKQLAAMGVKSIKGMRFGNGSIRNILNNITYTGNFLFQKEYISDPITGKSRINRGELPQYFVENTHEAIIPMETYQAVQKEKARRRELGVFANWSIPKTCFTSKIKCGICGKSYRRSGKRQRKDQNEVYYVWICQTKSRKGIKYCTGKILPEKKLKEVCAEVLGTDGFDEEAFLAKVERIVVVGEDTLEFHFYDGTVLEKQWQSTAKKEWWTEERRKAWGEMHKHKATNPNRNRYYEFSGLIKCGQCGANFRCQSDRLKDSAQTRKWHCNRTCGNINIRDDILKAMVCDILGIPEFSEEQMDSEIEKITVDNQKITFQFMDGHTEDREYAKPKRQGKKHTEEVKQHLSEVMKARWKEGRMNGKKKSNDHPGDD